MLTKDVPAFLESAWEMRREVVPCLLGEPGIGKTQMVYQFAEGKGAKVVEVIASQILPNEVSGITMPVDATHSMEVYDHARLSSLEDGDILFFDELLQASPQVLSACLTLIQERRMMSGRMLPDVMIVAAANPLPTPASIPMSIRQRFMFVKVGFDREQWLEHVGKRFHLVISSTGMPELCLGYGNARYDRSKSEWNELTPRTLTKLMEWYDSIMHDKAKVEAWKDYVSQEFGRITSEWIMRELGKSNAKRQLLGTLSEMKLELDVEGMVLLPINEIMARLTAMDEWPEVEARLKEVIYIA